MKKEFISYWSTENITADVHKMTITKARFFSDTHSKYSGNCEIIVPDNVTHDQLCVFIGRKTKITVETVD